MGGGAVAAKTNKQCMPLLKFIRDHNNYQML